MVDLRTGLTTVHKFTMDALNSYEYSVNGWDRMHRWNGITSTSEEAGVEALDQSWDGVVDASAAGNTTVGQHVLRYRYRDSETSYVSNPSNEVTVTVSGGSEAITFNIGASPDIVTPVDAKMDKIVIEMTTAGPGVEFFEAVEVDSTAVTVTVDIDDNTLSGKALEYDDDGHDRPPFFSVVVAHKGRLIGAGQVVHTEGTVDVVNGDPNVAGTGTGWTEAVEGRFLKVGTDTEIYQIQTFNNSTSLVLEKDYNGVTANGVSYEIFSGDPNVVFESLPLRPESWPPLNFTRAMVSKHDKIRGMITYHGTLLICGDRNTERWSYTASLVEDGQPYPIPGNRGCLNSNTLVEVDGTVYGWDRQGIWAWSGGHQKHISYPVDPLFQVMNWDVAECFHSVFIPQERTIRFYWSREDDEVTDSRPKDFLEYQIDKQVWGTGRHVMAMTASATVGTGRERRAMLGDENGYLWYVLGFTEGSEPTTTLVGTVSAGATDTIISIDEGGLATANEGLAGVPCYSVELDEEQIIDSNTATEVTLLNSFSVAPSTGTTLYFGRIRALLRTKAISLGQLKNKQWPKHLDIYLQPNGLTPAGVTNPRNVLIVRIYDEYGDTAKNNAISTANVTQGVSTTVSTSEFTLDMSKLDGYLRVPMGQQWARTKQIEFEIRGPDTKLILIGFNIEGLSDRIERLI